MKNKVRYILVSILFLASTLNYADRAALGTTKNGVATDLGLGPVAIGFLLGAWAWSYCIAQIPAGWLLDRFGSKRVYGYGIFLWSFFIFLVGFTGFLKGQLAFIAFSGLLLLAGFALAPAFPGNGRFVAAWFPTAERGTASAIFNSSQYFSLVLFGPLMGWIMHKFGWQYVFWTMGALGIVLTPVWFKVAYSPKQHPSVSAAELEYIEKGGALVNMDMSGKAGARFTLNWSHVRQLLSSRMLIGVYIAQFCITTVTYFFVTWFTGYLQHERGMNIVTAGFIAAPTALCGCVGGVLGGRFSDSLLKRGRSLSFSRKLPIVIGMLLSCIMIVCIYVTANWLIVVIMCLAFFGKGFGALGWTVVSDTSPKEITGLSGGLFNTFGNLAAPILGFTIGLLLKWTGSFNFVLVYVGANALGAIFCYLFVVGEIKRLELRVEPNLPSPPPIHQ